MAYSSAYPVLNPRDIYIHSYPVFDQRGLSPAAISRGLYWLLDPVAGTRSLVPFSSIMSNYGGVRMRYSPYAPEVQMILQGGPNAYRMYYPNPGRWEDVTWEDILVRYGDFRPLPPARGTAGLSRPALTTAAAAATPARTQAQSATTTPTPATPRQLAGQAAQAVQAQAQALQPATGLAQTGRRPLVRKSAWQPADGGELHAPVGLAWPQTLMAQGGQPLAISWGLPAEPFVAPAPGPVAGRRAREAHPLDSPVQRWAAAAMGYR